MPEAKPLSHVGKEWKHEINCVFAREKREEWIFVCNQLVPIALMSISGKKKLITPMILCLVSILLCLILGLLAFKSNFYCKGGGRGDWDGNTCKPMAVSFQCMTKSTTNKKK